MTYEEAESILQAYDLEDILELNELTLEDALCFLVNQGIVELPDVRPV